MNGGYDDRRRALRTCEPRFFGLARWELNYVPLSAKIGTSQPTVWKHRTPACSLLVLYVKQGD